MELSRVYCKYEDLEKDLKNIDIFKPAEVFIKYMNTINGEELGWKRFNNTFLIVAERNALRWIDDKTALNLLNNKHYRNQMTLLYSLILNHLENMRLKLNIDLNGDTWKDYIRRSKDLTSEPEKSLVSFIHFIGSDVTKSSKSWLKLLEKHNDLPEYRMFKMGMENLLKAYNGMVNNYDDVDTSSQEAVSELYKSKYKMLNEQSHKTFFEVIMECSFQDFNDDKLQMSYEEYYAREHIFDILLKTYDTMSNMGELQYYQQSIKKIKKILPLAHNV